MTGMMTTQLHHQVTREPREELQRNFHQIGHRIRTILEIQDQIINVENITIQS